MTIEITSEGGFTGRGVGAVRIEDPLPEDVARAVASARPETWKRSYEVTRGADLVRYTLRMDDVVVSWVTTAEIPEDLRELFEAVWRAGTSPALHG